MTDEKKERIETSIRNFRTIVEALKKGQGIKIAALDKDHKETEKIIFYKDDNKENKENEEYIDFIIRDLMKDIKYFKNELKRIEVVKKLPTRAELIDWD